MTDDEMVQAAWQGLTPEDCAVLCDMRDEILAHAQSADWRLRDVPEWARAWDARAEDARLIDTGKVHDLPFIEVPWP